MQDVKDRNTRPHEMSRNFKNTNPETKRIKKNETQHEHEYEHEHEHEA
jgi:hypothetical protein